MVNIFETSYNWENKIERQLLLKTESQFHNRKYMS